MIRTLSAAFLAVSLVYAQAPDPIRAVVADLNKALARSDTAAFTEIFTADAELQQGSATVTGPAAIAGALQKSSPLDELTPPAIEISTVRTLSPNFALVEGSQVRHSPVNLNQRTPVALLMRRTLGEWRILSMKLGAAPDNLPAH